jgi:hypothetical protein
VANGLRDDFIASLVVSEVDVEVDFIAIILQFDDSILKIMLLIYFYFFNLSKHWILCKNKLTMF